MFVSSGLRCWSPLSAAGDYKNWIDGARHCHSHVCIREKTIFSFSFFLELIAAQEHFPQLLCVVKLVDIGIGPFCQPQIDD